MYALVDPKSFCHQLPAGMSALPTNQIYMTPVPMTPTYLIGGAPTQVVPMTPNPTPTGPGVPPLYYALHPSNNNTFCQQPAYVPTITSSRQRTSSDDVFIYDINPQTSTNGISVSNNHNVINNNRYRNTLRPKRRQRMVGAADVDDVMSLDSNSPPRKGDKSRGRSNYVAITSSDSSSGEYSPHRSHDSGRSSGASSIHSSPPQNMMTSDNNYSSSHESMSGTHREAVNDINDCSLFNIFSHSLYSALNRDPPEPTATNAERDSDNNLKFPLKTSSPIPDERGFPIQNQITLRNDNDIKAITRRTRSEQRGEAVSLQSENESVSGQGGHRRQKFLRALEEERNRQKALVLPRHAPKMNCKFCKNNGEVPEIYTKHRLHFKEKTVCPLLRMYVCRLCNSTGDFAHTIRHCPFNARFDKVAWKATFL